MRSRPLSILSYLCESRITSVILKSREDKGTWANCRYHKSVYRPSGRALSRLWCAGTQTFMAAGGRATLGHPGAPGLRARLLPFLLVNRCVLQRRQWSRLIPAVCSIHVCLMNTALSASPVQEKTVPLKSACKLTCLFGLLTPMSDVRPRHPHIKGNGVGGGVGGRIDSCFVENIDFRH